MHLSTCFSACFCHTAFLMLKIISLHQNLTMSVEHFAVIKPIRF